MALGVELKAAVIAFAAALGGAAVGGGFTIWAAKTQISGEHERSRAEFLRAQRQTAYSAVLSDTSQLITASVSFVRAFDNNAVVDVEAINRLYGEVHERRNKLNDDVASVRVIGSEDMAEAADNVVRATASIQSLIFSVYFDHGQKLADVARLSDELSDSYTSTTDALKRFEDEAHHDLVES